MENPDSETPDEKGAGTNADNAETPAHSINGSSNSEAPSEATPPRSWPDTAIERQIARTSALRYRKRTHQEAPDRPIGRRKMNYYASRRKACRFDLAILFVFLSLAAVGLAWVFTDPGRPMQSAISTIRQMVWPTAATHNPSPVGAAQTTVPKVAEVSPRDELSIRIADAPLRSRPELFEQLVQVYRSRLADNPSDSTAQAALNRLQEQSLSELETIIAEGDDSTADKSLQVVSRLFPELANNSRYQYLRGRVDYINRHATNEQAAEPERSTPLATAIPPEKTASSQKTAPPEKTISPEKTVSAPADSSASVAKKTVENAPPLKPEIRSVSITPGRMAEGRFIPGDGGNVFMVEISYRNFDKIIKDQSDVTLVTRLGIPGDSMVLAEAPVVISGDRGTGIFLIETLTPGNTGEKYQLNFLLNGEFLTSRTVRLSIPGR